MKIINIILTVSLVWVFVGYVIVQQIHWAEIKKQKIIAQQKQIILAKQTQ